MGKLINRIPGSRILTSSSPGSASLTMSTSVVKGFPGKIDIKRRKAGILYLLHVLFSVRTMKSAVMILVLMCCLVTLNITMGAETSKLRYVIRFFDLERCCRRVGCTIMGGNCVPINKGCYCLDKFGLLD